MMTTLGETQNMIFLQLVLLQITAASHVVSYLDPPRDISVEILANCSVLLLWSLPELSEASFFRITLVPGLGNYKIIKEVPATDTSVMLDYLLPKATYNMSIQSGDGELLGPTSPVINFYLNTAPESEDNNTTLSWRDLSLTLSTGPKTEEIVIVSLVVTFWIIVMCVFMTKWAKIRVIEPRYFDYNFLLKYDKAFALRNTAISGTGLNGPRKSIAPSLTGIRIGARPSISATSIRNVNVAGLSGNNSLMDGYKDLHYPVQPTRPLLLPLRLQNHRYSHDIRIELSHVQDDEQCGSPASV